MSEHLDLDALADVLAGDVAPGHVAECPTCTAALDALRVADERVRAALGALPSPELPADVAGRLDAALANADVGSVTTLPAAAARRTRWLPAAAAAVLLLAGGAFGASQLSGRDDDPTATAASDAGAGTLEEGLDVVRNSTGRDYTGRADLASAVRGLLAGEAPPVVAAAPAPAAAGSTRQGDAATPEADAPAMAMTADALAPLRTDAGLAECLLALLPPDDPSVTPLALDYGSFKGTPALVVLLPGAQPRKLDVFVVGAGCSRANDSLLFYASVDAP